MTVRVASTSHTPFQDDTLKLCQSSQGGGGEERAEDGLAAGEPRGELQDARRPLLHLQDWPGLTRDEPGRPARQSGVEGAGRVERHLRQARNSAGIA